MTDEECETDDFPGFARELEAELESAGSTSLSLEDPDFEARKAFVKDVLNLKWSPGDRAWIRKPV